MDGNISENSSLEEIMVQEMHNLRPLPSIRSIHIVPERRGHIKQTIYTPKVVSIGPYHHGREELKAMEEYKKWCFDDFIYMNNQPLVSYIKVVQKKELELRAYYAEAIEFGENEFLKIILVDAVFIIVFLLRLKFRDSVYGADCMIRRELISQGAWYDMLMLENQLPFFVLVDLFGFWLEVCPNSGDKIDIFDLSYNFFKELMHLKVPESALEGIRSFDIQHFVDFLRVLHSPFISKDARELERAPSLSINLSLPLEKGARVEPRAVTIPSISELHKAGVRFKVGGSTNLFDLQLNNGILEFPKLMIGKESEISTRNMLVFEKFCHTSNHINDSIVLMDNLIKTQKDVDLLVKFGILHNRLGDSGKVSLLIKELADGTFLDWKRFEFASLCEKLNTYCGHFNRQWKVRWFDWKENLIETYFKTPWSGISVVVGVVLLTLTVVQTVYAYLSFRSPNSVGN